MNDAIEQLCDILRDAGATLTLYGRPVTASELRIAIEQRIAQKFGLEPEHHDLEATMKNLAGSEDADTEIRYELSRAIIDVIPIDRSKFEVKASLGGKLGNWTFTRNWYYWVAKAPEGQGVPIEVARELYADPVGKSDIRVGGHCGCPPPDEYGATYLDADGRLLIAERERKDFEHFFAEKILSESVLEGTAFTADPKTDHHHATIDLYHIDSELGLRLFANVLRGLQKGPA